MKALILEDNLSLALSLKKTLEGQGWAAETSPSWAKAAPKVESHKFQLILLDILLEDKKGVEVLKILSEKEIRSKIIVITGFFNEETVFKGFPPAFLKNCFFLKKPLKEEELLDLVRIEDKTQSKKWSFFFEKGLSEKPLSFYFPETPVFESNQLVPLLFTAHLKAFTGDIVLGINSQPNSIHFYKGNIIKIVSSSANSFFGEILVEHGLSLTDDVKEVLNDKKSNKRIGEKLLEKELLSPHMLDFILKEQMKIRLSEFMSYPSFQLQLLEKKPEDFEKIEIEFNKTDFIDWLADSIQTELKPDFWKSFYFDIKTYKLSRLSLLNIFSISQKSFFNSYNSFFKSLDTNKRAGKLIKDWKEDSIKYLFFGLLIKSIYLKKLSKEKQAFQEFKKNSHQILSSSEEEIWRLLGYPNKQLKLKDLKANYKDLTRKIHPDFLPKGAAEKVKQEAEQSLKKVNEIYKELLKKWDQSSISSEKRSFDLVNVMNVYKEGTDLIQKESYSRAFEALSKIKDHKQAPSNTRLYMLWAELKKQAWDLMDKDRKKGLDIRKQINNYPIHLRTSYLFWFVKGLFYYECKKYDKAMELFRKTLYIESSFSQAKLALLLAKQKLQEQNKNNNKRALFSFFKKSG